MTAAVGYIRQSRRADLDVALSYDSQLASIHRLAQRDGVPPDKVRILSDMGRSGAAGKERQRPAYQQLLQHIGGNGHGTTVYALSMSRLARSLDELRRVYLLAADHGVRIVFEKEGEIAFGSPIGKLHATLVGAVYEFERELAVDRARENVQERRRRGQKMGRRWYGERDDEDPEHVLDAFRTTGSYNGAARLLNDRGIPTSLRVTPDGSTRKWTGTTVRGIVEHYAPDLMPRHPRKGAGGRASFRLAGLLRCGCGRMLTGYHHKSGKIVRYKCHAAEADRTHARPYSVAESAVMPWIMSTADSYRLPDAVRTTGDPAGQRAALEVERRQVTMLGAVPGADLDFVRARLADIDARVDALEDEVAVEQVGPVDWVATPTPELNSLLRTYFRHVQLDDTMRPIEVDWRLARMREGAAA